MGGDVPDDTPDAEVEADTGIAFQFFTLKNLVAFFSIFGWTGIACIDSGLSETTSLIIALIAGLIMMTVMASIFYFLGKANADGTLKMKNAVGGVGEVYMNIKNKRGGIGKVQIKIQGSLRTLDAMTDDDQDIPTGKIITVTSVVNDSILVVTAK
jgi:membrane protein implicated in regulation of membrane protease activity